VPLEEQEWLTLPEHLNATVLVGIVSQIFSYVCSVLFVLFLLATDCLFKTSDYPLWYLQTFLT